MIDVFSAPAGASPVVIEATFEADAHRLFDAWTRPEQLRRWFGHDPSDLRDIQIDLKEGGRWRFVMGSGEGREESLEGHYTKIVPGRSLVFSWSHHVRHADGKHERTPPSEVAIHFEPIGASTRMTLEHREIRNEGGRLGVRKGWIKSFRTLADLLGAEASAAENR